MFTVYSFSGAVSMCRCRSIKIQERVLEAMDPRELFVADLDLGNVASFLPFVLQLWALFFLPLPCVLGCVLGPKLRGEPGSAREYSK